MKFAVGTALCVALLSTPSVQPDTGEILLAVLRADGAALPFASFDGGRWHTRWPAAFAGRQLPLRLEDVPGGWWGVDPAPTQMALWQGGERAATVALTGVAPRRVMCEPRLMVVTDFAPRLPIPPPLEQPYPKEGLLVAGAVDVGSIAAVPEGNADHDRLARVIREGFDREEARAIGQFTDWRHPVSGSARRRVPIRLEAVYRGPSNDPGWTAFYVEAVRQFPPGSEDTDGCGLESFAHGWVMLGPGDRSHVGLSARITYCDRKGAGYMLPFGWLRANGTVFWVYQFSGFDGEWYEVAEPTRRGARSRAAYPGGTCPY